jgi:hypothetical protein
LNDLSGASVHDAVALIPYFVIREKASIPGKNLRIRAATARTEPLKPAELCKQIRMRLGQPRELIHALIKAEIAV